VANTRSGAAQTLSVGGVTISGPDHGFTGLTLDVAGATFDSVSGGLSRTFNAGTAVVSGSFSCDETETTNRALLGKSGSRQQLVWNSGADTLTFQAVLEVSRNFDERGGRTFSVAFTVDGAIT